ncbi:hypothetical protein NPIL_228611 [Nephila pilipes]|uniref:Uncharacterized protein n=1 Tax=Nephila pilipes TaxID=299642 RepID=A0A8X6U2H2_NEPPI|nr:hypothetical protein NPIL_228611 [Nephila pilipes]
MITGLEEDEDFYYPFMENGRSCQGELITAMRIITAIMIRHGADDKREVEGWSMEQLECNPEDVLSKLHDTIKQGEEIRFPTKKVELGKTVEMHVI